MFVALEETVRVCYNGITTLAATFEKTTLVKNYLGYVSSLARESIFVSLPRGGPANDGIRRTRAFKSGMVRLGDVEDMDTGHPLHTSIGVALRVGQLAMGQPETT